MAKRTRYSSNNIVADYQRTQKSKALKKKNPEKYKRQKFISKISSDGKISKKEGQKAARKGISLQKIQNRNIGDYREAARGFDSRSNRTQVRNSAASRPTFEPLKIKGGAIQAQQRGQNQGRPDRSKKQGGGKNKKNKVGTPQTPTATKTEIPTPETFEPDTPDFEGMMAEQAAQYQRDLDAMRAEQEARDEEYRRQAEEQRRQFELAQRTMIGNEARAGQQASYQLGGAAGMKRGGTFGFRRRKRNLMGGISSAVAAGGGGGTLNV
jgi:hypothetical protein